MKKLRNLLGGLVLILAASLPVRAQFYGETASITNFFAATTTNTVTTAVIDVTRWDEFTIQPVFKLDGAGTTACVFTLKKSVDGVNYVADSTISVTPAGTATVSAAASVTAGSFPYYQITQVSNPNSAGMTNLVINIGKKNALKKYAP